MKELIDSFAEQLDQSILLGKSQKDLNNTTEIHNVIITGMGGSGIGGNIVSALLSEECSLPIMANSDYTIPSYANENTLLIVSSYSGNTEETISAMEIGIEKGCQVACVTSGGTIKDLAVENGYYLIEIPGGNPPRSMFAFSAIQQLYVLKAFGVISDSFESKLNSSVELLRNEKNSIIELAKSLAEKLQGRIPLIYTDSWLNGVAVRWCQQLNENSKMLCWTNPFPESNHNELVGWEGGDNRTAVILLKSEFDHERTRLRMDICTPIFESKCDTVLNIYGKGRNKVEVALYFVVLGDWLSWYLSELNGVDAVEIKNILHLKGALSAHTSV